MSYDFLTLGENMIRLSTRNYERLEQAQTLDIKHGGTEANVAVALARLGYKPAWLSRLVRNPLGAKIADDLAQNGVDTRHVLWTDEGRVGLFFLEVGTPPRASSVVYDRRNSAMSQLSSSDFPWDLLRETKWLHLTGITAGLSANCLALVNDAMQRAQTLNLTTSFDVNYRARLWTAEQARAALAPLCAQADVAFVTQNDAIKVFGAQGDTPEARLAHLAHGAQGAQPFGRKLLVMTLSAEGSIAYERATDRVFRAAPFRVAHTVDRIGAGDAFAAGFLAGYWEQGVERGLTLGNAIAALKMTIHGDLALVTRREVEELVAGASGGIVR